MAARSALQVGTRPLASFPFAAPYHHTVHLGAAQGEGQGLKCTEQHTQFEERERGAH